MRRTFVIVPGCCFDNVSLLRNQKGDNKKNPVNFSSLDYRAESLGEWELCKDCSLHACEGAIPKEETVEN